MYTINSQCSGDDAFNCMRLTNITKCSDVCRHLDNLLIDARGRIGTIRRVQVLNNAHDPPLQRDKFTTVAFIQLKDADACEEFSFLLNGYVFHGSPIHVSRAQYTFLGLDDTYVPRGIDCPLCRNFKRDTAAMENELIERLLTDEKKRQMRQFPISKAKRPSNNEPPAHLRNKSPLKTAKSTLRSKITAQGTATPSKTAQSTAAPSITAQIAAKTAPNSQSTSTINAISQADEPSNDLTQRYAGIIALMLRARISNTTTTTTTTTVVTEPRRQSMITSARRAIALPAPTSSETPKVEQPTVSLLVDSHSTSLTRAMGYLINQPRGRSFICFSFYYLSFLVFSCFDFLFIFSLFFLLV